LQKYALGKFKEYAQRMKWTAEQQGVKGTREFVHSVGIPQFEMWAYNASDGKLDAIKRWKVLETAMTRVAPKEGRW
jgi:hypothetical protein